MVTATSCEEDQISDEGANIKTNIMLEYSLHDSRSPSSPTCPSMWMMRTDWSVGEVSIPGSTSECHHSLHKFNSEGGGLELIKANISLIFFSECLPQV